MVMVDRDARGSACGARCDRLRACGRGVRRGKAPRKRCTRPKASAAEASAEKKTMSTITAATMTAITAAAMTAITATAMTAITDGAMAATAMAASEAAQRTQVTGFCARGVVLTEAGYRKASCLKRLGLRYRSGRSPDRLKAKNPAPAVKWRLKTIVQERGW